MQTYLKDILIHILNIIALFLMLRFILYKPVKEFMDKRSEKIASQLQEAKDANQKGEEMKADYEKQLLEAKNKCDMLIEDATKKAKDDAAAIIEEANAKSEQLLIEAREEAEKEKQEALKQAKEQITDISLSIARKILQREVTLADNEEVINEYFRREVHL